MTRPRNERADHPAWCRRQEPSDGLPRHRSAPARVGARRLIGDRGEVTVYLAATGNGPAWVAVNVAHMVGVTAEISLLDAADLRDALTGLLQAAAYE